MSVTGIDINELIDLVEEWGDERRITGPDGSNNLYKQFRKLQEEVQELEDAINQEDNAEIVDAIGDCTVVLTLLARALRFDTGEPHSLSSCLHLAYDEIKDRTGSTVDGVFVKD